MGIVMALRLFSTFSTLLESVAILLNMTESWVANDSVVETTFTVSGIKRLQIAASLACWQPDRQ